MIIDKVGSEFIYEGVTYRIGDKVIGTNSSEYAGLNGVIFEIRDGEDKETDNDTLIYIVLLMSQFCRVTLLKWKRYSQKCISMKCTWRISFLIV